MCFWTDFFLNKLGLAGRDSTRFFEPVNKAWEFILPSESSNGAIQEHLKRETSCWREKGGEGVGSDLRIVQPQEKLVLYQSFNTIWYGICYHEKSSSSVECDVCSVVDQGFYPGSEPYFIPDSGSKRFPDRHPHQRKHPGSETYSIPYPGSKNFPDPHPHQRI